MASNVSGNAVGYKNPPKHSQYLKGLSGNPRGRPKNIQSSVAILREVLQQTVQVTENNNTRKITKAEALVKVIFLEATKGTRQYPDALITIFDSIERLVHNPMAPRGGIVLLPGMAQSNEEFEEMARQHREFLEREEEMQSMKRAAEKGRTNLSAKLPPRKLTRRTTS